MASKRLHVRHTFGGGFASDFGPSANVAPTQSGEVVIPYLLDAENVFFELDGGPHKIGGASKINSSAIESGEEIRGLFDYWRQGTTSAPLQRRVVFAGTKILADNADGTFAAIKTGLEDNKVPCFTVFEDNLILSTDSTVDVPMTYDGTTVTNLGGSAPNFAFSCVHKNRVWAAGVATAPSTLYYSRTLNAGDWTHATSGSIDIDPDDGDRITAIASHKNDLWVLKGPYKGSIHRITGSSNTGSDSFQRVPFINGVGALSHNTLFRFRDDLGFMWSDGTIHSLAATAAYGDFTESALSRPIHRYLREHLTHGQLARSWAATDVARSLVAFTVPIDTALFPNQTLVMDYSRQQVWWALWPALNANCIAAVYDTTGNRQILMAGGRDGYVRRTDTANRAIDASTAIAAKITTPYNNYGSAALTKTITDASMGISPRGNYDVTFKWTRDDEIQQSASVEQGGGDVLAPADANQFTLDTSALGGSQFVDRFMELEEGGEFRSVSYQVLQSGVNEDLELHSISASFEPGALSTVNV
jgi:hypothetical protein